MIRKAKAKNHKTDHKNPLIYLIFLFIYSFIYLFIYLIMSKTDQESQSQKP